MIWKIVLLYINDLVIHILPLFVPFTVLIFSIFTGWIGIYIILMFFLVLCYYVLQLWIAASLHLTFMIFKMSPSPPLSSMMIPEKEKANGNNQWVFHFSIFSSCFCVTVVLARLLSHLPWHALPSTFNFWISCASKGNMNFSYMEPAFKNDNNKTKTNSCHTFKIIKVVCSCRC